MGKTLVIVDSNNSAWKAYHAYSRLSYKNFVVSIIYGLVTMVRSYISRFNPDEMILVWDGGHSKERVKVLPNYKERAHKSLTDYKNFLKQKSIVQKMFKHLGVKQIFNSKGEADDMIYKLTKLAGKNGFTNVIIISNDKDFDQLIDANVSIFNDKRKKKTIITEENCFEEKGYHAHNTVDWLTLIGDNSDNIPGYPGIGPTKAAQLLEKYGSLANFLKSNDDHTIIKRDKLLELIDICRVLIDLRYFYSKFKDQLKTEYIGGKNPKLNVEKFNRLARKYNMTKLMGNSFIRPFKTLK